MSKMPAIYNDYKNYQYGIDGSAKIATDFYPLEKTSKIVSRILRIVNIFGKLPHSFVMLSSQIKDFVLAIESTRFFCVSFPLFFRDKAGRSFFQVKSGLQCSERISITSHLALKTLFGADYIGLIRLGIIGTYALGNMSVFRWMLEGTIFMYNFCGAFDGSKDLMNAKQKMETTQIKINTLNLEMAVQDINLETAADKRKWEMVKSDLQFDQAKAAFKIAAKVSKLVMIIFAVSLAAVNIANVPCEIVILSLGILSDSIGITAFFHQEYWR